MRTAPSDYGASVARIHYIDDPDAPKANSVVPSVVAIVQDGEGRQLLIHKTDNRKWALPGGGHDIGDVDHGDRRA